MDINNNKFKILNLSKTLIELFENYLSNIPRKDIYYKDEIRKTLVLIFKYIIMCNNDLVYKNNLIAEISYLDCLLEIIYEKNILMKIAYQN